MNITNVRGETLKIRSTIKATMDSKDNPIDTKLDPVLPFKGSDEIKLIIIGQDPTIKNEKQRGKIKTTLNLDKGGSLKTYITGICDSLGLKLESVYATNIFKYFYSNPPANTMEVLRKQLDINLKLLLKELENYPKIPVVTLGEPVLQLLSNKPDDKVRSYWGYEKGENKLPLMKCTENKLRRPFYPFPHQPSSGKKFYAETLKEYLNFVKKDALKT